MRFYLRLPFADAAVKSLGCTLGIVSRDRVENYGVKLGIFDKVVVLLSNDADRTQAKKRKDEPSQCRS